MILGVQREDHLVLGVILIPFMQMDIVLMLHVDATVIHPPETPLQLLQMFTLPDSYRVPVTILESLLNLQGHEIQEMIVIFVQTGYFLRGVLDQAVELHYNRLHLDIIGSFCLIGSKVPH